MQLSCATWRSRVSTDLRDLFATPGRVARLFSQVVTKERIRVADRFPQLLSCRAMCRWISVACSTSPALLVELNELALLLSFRRSGQTLGDHLCLRSFRLRVGPPRNVPASPNAKIVYS